MQATLDLKVPTLVSVGAWNHAIFGNPEWVAKHLLGIPSGEQVGVTIFQQNEISPRVLIFDDVAISVNGPRLEICSNSVESFGFLEVFVQTICKTVPHTPVNALGINFKYAVSAPDQRIFDMFETKENLESLGQVLLAEQKTQILFERNVLNIKRVNHSDVFELDFNFHFDVNGIERISEILVGGFVGNCFNTSKEIAEKYYGISEVIEDNLLITDTVGGS